MKQAFEQKLQAQMDAWNAEIKKLGAKAEEASADAQLEYYKQIENLRERQQDAQDKLNELRRSGDDAWEDMKSGLETAWQSVDAAVKAAVSRFK